MVIVLLCHYIITNLLIFVGEIKLIVGGAIKRLIWCRIKFKPVFRNFKKILLNRFVISNTHWWFVVLRMRFGPVFSTSQCISSLSAQGICSSEYYSRQQKYSQFYKQWVERKISVRDIGWDLLRNFLNSFFNHKN